ncbi:MAG: class I SAM-dependent methyltransferase [Anaerolineales bacterium]
MKIDNFLRKFIPAVPLLSRTPVGFFLDLPDIFIRKSRREWNRLPPASLRMRIGVGNRLLFNHQAFLYGGRSLVEELSGRGYLCPTSDVLELGCGCGRNAIALIDFLDEGGSYIGQDVDSGMISWCKSNLSDDRTRFFHADLYSGVYNPEGRKISDYKFPASDHSIDLITAVSVFSHLLYNDLVHYLREASRVLRVGGNMHMTLFVMDYIRPRLGDRWHFSHKKGPAYVESPRYPEAAVAYDESTIEAVLEQNDLQLIEIYNQDVHQQTLIVSNQG